MFIDTSAYWSSGFDPERTITDLLASTEYTEADPLYENGLSVVYLLTK